MKRILITAIAICLIPSLAFAATHFKFSSSQWIATSGYTPTGSESIVFWGYLDSLPSTNASDMWNGANCDFIFGVTSAANKPSSIIYKNNACGNSNQLTANNALSINTWYCF